MAVFALGMKTAIQAFRNDAPLHGNITRVLAVNRAVFVHAPADGTMVHDDILAIGDFERVQFAAHFVTQPKAHVANDNIMRGDPKYISRDANAVTGSTLSRDRDVRFAQS